MYRYRYVQYSMHSILYTHIHRYICVYGEKKRELLGYNRFQEKMSEETIKLLNYVLEK